MKRKLFFAAFLSGVLLSACGTPAANDLSSSSLPDTSDLSDTSDEPNTGMLGTEEEPIISPGVIEEIHDGYMTVNMIPYEDNPGTGLANIPFEDTPLYDSEGNELKPEDFQVGDNIELYHNGIVARSYPAQFPMRFRLVRLD